MLICTSALKVTAKNSCCCLCH